MGARTHTSRPRDVDARTCTRADNETRAHAYPHWSANSLHRRAIALRRSRRLCAAFGTTASRWSRIGRIDGHTAQTCARPSVLTDTDGKQTAYAALSQTVCGSQHTPAAVSPQPKISRVDLPAHTTSSVVSHSFFLERHIELIRPTQIRHTADHP